MNCIFYHRKSYGKRNVGHESSSDSYLEEVTWKDAGQVTYQHMFKTAAAAYSHGQENCSLSSDNCKLYFFVITAVVSDSIIDVYVEKVN